MKLIRYLTAAALACLRTGSLPAQNPNAAPNVLYTVSGKFATPPVSGSDVYKLAGEPFRVTITGNVATAPHAHGKAWADYIDLTMQGYVHTGLDPSPVPLSSNYTFLALGLGNPAHEVFEVQTPVIVIRQRIMVKAMIDMPNGTLAKGWLIFPFTAPVSLDPTDATVTYTETVNGQAVSTVLAIASGTLNAAYP